MTPVVQVQALAKHYRPSLFGAKVTALHGISFEVREGECLGVLGPNGAGKSTTLKILTGLLRPDGGSAELLGRPCGEPRARRELGYLPENPWYHEHLNPVEGLMLHGRLAGLSRREIRERTPDLLDRVGLTDARGRRLRTFSKGMRQRFGLAAALLHRPRLLLLDEPLSGLDPAGRRLFKDLIQEERDAGRTVLLSSHVLGDVQELCERVLVMKSGRVAAEGSIAELMGGDPQHCELIVADAPSELRARIAARASSWSESGAIVTARLPGDEGSELASAVAAAGGHVRSLIPERETLEEWFVRVIDGEVGAPVEPVESLEEVQA